MKRVILDTGPLNPKGIPASKPRFARNELPWRQRGKRTPALGLMILLLRSPRVARSSQPWAARHNPVGIAELLARWRFGLVARDSRKAFAATCYESRSHCSRRLRCE